MKLRVTMQVAPETGQSRSPCLTGDAGLAFLGLDRATTVIVNVNDFTEVPSATGPVAPIAPP
jgi:hypothetical protein